MKLISDHTYPQNVREDAWEKLKQFTDARIALGRTGCSIPTHAMLEFQLAHAQARDAVYQQLNVEQLAEQLKLIGLESQFVTSQAEDKKEYLKRPDLGRLLNQESVAKLKEYQIQQTDHYDVCIVVGDGLSALAIEENAFKMIEALKSEITKLDLKLAPIVIASGSRVALGDQVAEILNCKMLIMMIGERPGLSSPDSMGIYYTYAAKTGSLDSQRNCISNIRPAGLSVYIATQRLVSLMTKSNTLGYSGVNLKDEHEVPILETEHSLKKLF